LTAPTGPGPGSAVVVLPVREGALPLGGADVAWEIGPGGLTVLMGTGCAEAAAALPAALTAWGWDAGPYAPGSWAEQLAPLLRSAGQIVLPASPDGRDLAPRLAAALERPLVAGALEVRDGVALVPRWEGASLAEVAVDPRAVVTRLPNTAQVALPTAPSALGATYRELSFPLAPPAATPDAELVELLAADPSTVDLSEARRIIAGGAGLGGPEAFAVLDRIATALSASLGATRLAADLGWVDGARYIGTTGVTVDPELYVAIGISGAVQHLTGIGDPRHIVAANLDPSCPMMSRAELALVCDVGELLAALAARLEVHADA
jgi:electron transfer flavoprotein alpha subunit